MSRLIDATTLRAEFTGNFQELLHYTGIWAMIDNAPTVDPVVHGRWDECDWVKYDGHGECIHYPKEALRCSHCCNAFKKELLWKRNYCPNCGAKMDLKED